MALKKSYNFKGIEITDGYHLVSNVRYDKLQNSIRFGLVSYFDEETRISGSNDFISEQTFYFTPSGSYDVVGDNDISTACYTYLKGLEEWSGSIDI